MIHAPVPDWLLDEPVSNVKADVLGFREPARLLADRLLACQQPGRALLVTVEGSFGSGKSSFCRLVAEALRSAQLSEGNVDPLKIDFDIWRSGSPDAGAWSAIAWRLGEKAYERLHERVAISQRDELALWLAGEWRKTRVEKLTDRRLHWTDVARSVSDAVLAQHAREWVRTLDLFSDAPRVIPGRELSGAAGAAVLARLLIASAPLLLAAVASPLAVPALAAATAATTAAGGAIDKIVEARKPGTMPWAVGTVEYARHLGRLLELLVNARVGKEWEGERGYRGGWRAILVVDELTRLPDDELVGAREALALLAEVPGLLVLLPMDERVLTALGLTRAAAGAEDPVTKLVHLRWQVPSSGWMEAVGFVRKWSNELGLPPITAAREQDEPSRHLVMKRGVLTPRQFKRSLLWVWTYLTLRECDGVLVRLRSGALPLTQLFTVLSDVGLFCEGRLERARLMETIQRHPRVLLHLPLQPWDLREWADRHGARHHDQEGTGAALTLALRRFAVATWAGASVEEERREGVAAYAAWRAVAAGRIRGGETPRGLLEGILGHTAYGDLLDVASLASAASRAGFVAGEAPKRFSEAVGSWMDGDVLFQAASDATSRRDVRAAALVLLGTLHPRLYRTTAADARRVLDHHGIRAMVEEASVAVLEEIVRDA